MNILLINHYAGSPFYGMAYRPYYLAKEWRKSGHNVHIVAASFSHLRSNQPKIDHTRKVNIEDIDDIVYTWVTTPAYSANGIKRFINILSFVFSLLIRRKKILNDFKPEVVIASSTYPLDIYPAYLISKLSGAELIFEVHDLWPLSPIEIGGLSKWNPFIILLQLAENFAYKRADHIVSMLPNTLEHMNAHGMSHDKFNYIPNGISMKEWEGSVTELSIQMQKTINEIKAKGHFIVGYAGYHGQANALEYIIKTMYLLRGKKISLLLIGDGPEKSKLKDMAENLGLENVMFLDPVNKHSIPPFLNLCDILFIGWRKNPIYRFGICPNKLMDYMMSGKPVIHSVEAGNDIVKDSGCGISVEPENPKAIADAIVLLMEKTQGERVNIGDKGKKYAIEHHNYKILAQRFLDIFSKKRED